MKVHVTGGGDDPLATAFRELEHWDALEDWLDSRDCPIADDDLAAEFDELETKMREAARKAAAEVKRLLTKRKRIKIKV